MKTISAKADGVKRDWFVIDATNKTLGRLCTELAHRLRGKHKPIFTPHVDTGDYLVVINAEKIHVTGAKLDDKNYHRFTGHIGNLKTTSLKDMLARHPERVLAVAGPDDTIALGFEHGSNQGCELVPGEVLLDPGHDLVGGGLLVVGSELGLIHSRVVGHRRSRLRAKSLDWKRNDRTGIRSMLQKVFQAGDRVVLGGREDL